MDPHNASRSDLTPQLCSTLTAIHPQAKDGAVRILSCMCSLGLQQLDALQLCLRCLPHASYVQTRSPAQHQRRPLAHRAAGATAQSPHRPPASGSHHQDLLPLCVQSMQHRQVWCWTPPQLCMPVLYTQALYSLSSQCGIASSNLYFRNMCFLMGGDTSYQQLAVRCQTRTSVTRAPAREARRAAPILGEPVWGSRGRLAPAAALRISSPVFLIMDQRAHSQADMPAGTHVP